jgi:hypothetical protein
MGHFQPRAASMLAPSLAARAGSEIPFVSFVFFVVHFPRSGAVIPYDEPC